MPLHSFLRYVEDTYCSLHHDLETIAEIQQAASDIVTDVIKRIGDLDARFSVSQIIPVGSFTEGTKIMAPNEFDFMVCLKCFSDKDRFCLKNGCDPGFKMVFLNTQDRELQQLGINLYNNVWCLSPESVKDYFLRNLEKVTKSLKNFSVIKSKGYMLLERSKHISLILRWLQYSDQKRGQIASGNETVTETSILSENVIKEGSVSSTLELNIDLMPAICIDDVAKIMDCECFPNKYVGDVQTFGCHLICKTCGNESPPLCFQISFAAAEVGLMSKLNPVHKRCYKILKYLLVEGTNLNAPYKSITLSSYMLKTAVLYHEYENLCTEHVTLTSCILEIIAFLYASFGEGVLRTFFMRHVNVWGRFYRIPVRYIWEPSGVTEQDCCRGYWCVTYWLEMWRQILGKALAIMGDLRYSSIEQGVTTDITSDTESTQTTKRTCNTFAKEYVPTVNDKFVDQFLELKQTITSVTTDYIEDGNNTQIVKLKPPSQELKQLLLPKFHEYVSLLEKICRKKLSIPVEYTPDPETDEVLSKIKAKVIDLNSQEWAMRKYTYFGEEEKSSQG